jgi:predicted transcriptional regulator
MRIMWRQGEATVGGVAAALEATAGRRHAYTTIMTIMGRLHDRGLLARTKRGRRYVYRPAQSEADLIEVMSGRAVDQLLQRYGTVALRHFATRLQQVDPDLRAQLVALAERRARGKAEDP